MRGNKMKSNKQGNVQSISWFYDLYKRDLLDLNPPYQRKSVWNQKYKDYFIDTILLSYPCPPIFLYEEIDKNGIAQYHVVDGKQRLTAIFEFLDSVYSVYSDCSIDKFKELDFSEFEDDDRIIFFSYSISVEYLPTNDEVVIKDIFQRLNKNIAKLTPQELRHARFDGEFINKVEELNEWMSEVFSETIPKFTRSAINKMKDVEYIVQLILMVEDGIKGYLPHELDTEFNNRDLDWDKSRATISTFKKTINKIQKISMINSDILRTRLKNQADFYGIFGALLNITDEDFKENEIYTKLTNFYQVVDNETVREEDENAKKYFVTVRTNTNKTTVRIDRIKLLTDLIK